MEGQVGQAILLGYHRAYLDFGSHSSTCLTDILLCDGGITISLWAYILGDSRSNANFQLFNTGGAMRSYSQFTSRSAVVCVYCGRQDFYIFGEFGIITREMWYHFTIKCDITDKGFLYINAENIPISNHMTTKKIPSNNFYIGALKAGGESFWDGEAYLDDISIFNRLLSDNEIQQIYDDTK